MKLEKLIMMNLLLIKEGFKMEYEADFRARFKQLMAFKHYTKEGAPIEKVHCAFAWDKCKW